MKITWRIPKKYEFSDFPLRVYFLVWNKRLFLLSSKQQYAALFDHQTEEGNCVRTQKKGDTYVKWDDEEISWELKQRMTRSWMGKGEERVTDEMLTEPRRYRQTYSGLGASTEEC